MSSVPSRGRLTSRLKLATILRRPTSISESVRWLFAGLTIASLLITLPAILSAARGPVLLMAVTAATVVIACWLFSYAIRRVPFWLDCVETVALVALALAAPGPEVVIGVMFSAIWFRGLYSSTARSLIRGVLYSLGLLATLPLWTVIGNHTAPTALGPLLSIFPLMFLTVLVGRQLGSGLRAREESLARNEVLAASGAQLLGVTDIATIETLGWRAMSEICGVTSKLRLIRARAQGGQLRVRHHAGDFHAVPELLPADLIVAGIHSARTVSDRAPLDSAAGAELRWVCLPISPEPDAEFLFVGSPKQAPDDLVLALKSLINQLALALRHSGEHQDLTVQARADPLTGLANRTRFTAELSARWGARELAAGTQVVFIDLDDFKDVNDVLGHQAGDDVLVEVAGRILECCRIDDLCARLGGDEFALLLPGAAVSDAQRIAERIVSRVAEPIRVGSGSLAQVGASVGIASATRENDEASAVHQADVAMYSAKAQGKGRVQVFHPALLKVDASPVAFDSRLVGAAAAGELVVHYQPILSLADLGCTAVEALVRWQHPEQGLLEPRDFLPIAESTGGIVEIGTFVLRQACADMRLLQDAHPHSPLALHVNVSVTQVEHQGFLDTVANCLAESGMPASSLVLEMTEGVGLDSLTVLTRLKVLTERGVRIAIDEFGTGYSSLSTLRSMPVHIIKLDQAFVDSAVANSVDRAAIEAIVLMTTRLGLCTIAEGAERLEQQELLREIGIDAVQGYLYQRPVPATQFGDWLNNNLLAHTATPGGDVTSLSARRTA